ncbi:hypothetical protein EVAR_100250_1 [Eumeta japonica]|uniref:Uncharacterized protein n=1 Tax=Eumeta variegata TaxID=151549 RepID=A0A4C2ADZ4_EUMVA|nr:hypothetical protein EVAR_100250_1 [Eumeta japonica]
MLDGDSSQTLVRYRNRKQDRDQDLESKFRANVEIGDAGARAAGRRYLECAADRAELIIYVVTCPTSANLRKVGGRARGRR